MKNNPIKIEVIPKKSPTTPRVVAIKTEPKV